MGVTRGTTIARREERSKLGDKWGTQDSNGRQKRDKEADKSETSWETKDHQKKWKASGETRPEILLPTKAPLSREKEPQQYSKLFGQKEGK